MTERERLVTAMARLEAQRDVLGDTAVDGALKALRTKPAEWASDRGMWIPTRNITCLDLGFC